MAARAQGRIGGRRPALSQDEIAQLSRLIKNGYSRKQLSIVYNVSLSTIYKYSTPEFTDLPQTTTQLPHSHNTQWYFSNMGWPYDNKKPDDNQWMGVNHRWHQRPGNTVSWGNGYLQQPSQTSARRAGIIVWEPDSHYYSGWYCLGQNICAGCGNHSGCLVKHHDYLYQIAAPTTPTTSAITGYRSTGNSRVVRLNTGRTNGGRNRLQHRADGLYALYR